MKQVLSTILLLSAAILTSCRKDSAEINIQQYDAEQIKNYIAANNLSSMQRDVSDGDTAGMYYQILEQGTGKAIEYSDRLAMVYTIRTFDGKFQSNDTIINHFSGYLGQFSSLGLPKGLQSAIYNVLKNAGGSMRLLIPSRLAYGRNGSGSGSSDNPNRIGGNQGLDYWVRIVDNQRAYDSIAIQKFASKYSINIGEYTHSSSGLYYKITGLDTGTAVTAASNITQTYTLRNFNNVVLQDQTTDYVSDLEGLITAVKEASLHAKTGQSISLLIPSGLAYGPSSQTSGGVTIIPSFSCLKYDYTIKSVKNYVTN